MNTDPKAKPQAESCKHVYPFSDVEPCDKCVCEELIGEPKPLASGEWRILSTTQDDAPLSFWWCWIFIGNDEVRIGPFESEQETLQTAARIVEDHGKSDLLLNILARIHRDGGHYVATHGLPKAIEDADRIVAKLNCDNDTLHQERDQLKDEIKDREQVQQEQLKMILESEQERDQLKAEVAKAQPAIDFCKGAFNETLNLINLSEHPTLVQLCEENQSLRKQVTALESRIEDLTH